jgi:Ca2+-transporting ATPase
MLESSLLFIGFAGMIDPQGEEAKQAVTQCKEGYNPVMITGDHKATARQLQWYLELLIPKKT